MAAIVHRELARLGYLSSETDAACAKDAAFLVEDNRGSDRKRLLALGLVLIETGIVSPVLHIVVLQLTLTRLIADGAIEGMIKKEKLEDRLPVTESLGCLGPNHQALRDGSSAGRLKLGDLLDLYQAHPAVPHDRQTRVVAIVGDLDTGLPRGLDHSHPFRRLHGLAVDRQCHQFLFRHGGSSVQPASPKAYRSALATRCFGEACALQN
jgi:hypothetical protein